jgi:Zn-dependent membrane protease YugP
MWTDRAAGIFFVAAPFLAILARTPLALAALVGTGIALLGVRVIVTLITLPVEFDASFRKALPIIEEGGYLEEKDLPAARSVLRAAALTYVAAALVTLVDLARWIRLLR